MFAVHSAILTLEWGECHAHYHKHRVRRHAISRRIKHLARTDWPLFAITWIMRTAQATARAKATPHPTRPPLGSTAPPLVPPTPTPFQNFLKTPLLPIPCSRTLDPCSRTCYPPQHDIRSQREMQHLPVFPLVRPAVRSMGKGAGCYSPPTDHPPGARDPEEGAQACSSHEDAAGSS